MSSFSDSRHTFQNVMGYSWQTLQSTSFLVLLFVKSFSIQQSTFLDLNQSRSLLSHTSNKRSLRNCAAPWEIWQSRSISPKRSPPSLKKKARLFFRFARVCELILIIVLIVSWKTFSCKLHISNQFHALIFRTGEDHSSLRQEQIKKKTRQTSSLSSGI